MPLPTADTTLRSADGAPQAGAASAAADAAGKLADELLHDARLGVGAPAAKTKSSAARAAPHQTQQTQQPAAETPHGAAAGDDLSVLPPELRSFGKASLERIKSLLPGHDGEATTGAEPPVQVNWSDGSAAGRSVDAALAGARADADQAHAANADATGPSRNAHDNLLRDSLQMLQQILTHPMTWLVISLFAIGAIAMSLADRRPK